MLLHFHSYGTGVCTDGGVVCLTERLSGIDERADGLRPLASQLMETEEGKESKDGLSETPVGGFMTTYGTSKSHFLFYLRYL